MNTLFRAFIIVAVLTSACGRSAAPPATEGLPTLDVTSWTDKTELFMEYPVLVTGHESLFAVHLTRMNDFSALNAGRPRLEFTPQQGGMPIVLNGNEPSRPGAFRVLANAPAAGTYRWALIIDAPNLTDRHDLGTVTVFPDESAARAFVAKQPAEDAAAIAYLKEQQWTNAFATAPVQEAEVRASVRAPAMVHPLPGGEAVVSAPAPGRLVADVLPSIGDRVRAGQVLARIEPRLAAGPDRATLVAEVAEAQASLDAARTEQTRAERLVADRALPARRAEEAQRAVKVAEARLTAAQARLEQRDETLRTGGGNAAGNAFALRAPISGTLAEVNATLGAAYDEGAALFKIVRTDRLELEVQVPAPDAAATRRAAGLALEIPGLPALRERSRPSSGIGWAPRSCQSCALVPISKWGLSSR